MKHHDEDYNPEAFQEAGEREYDAYKENNMRQIKFRAWDKKQKRILNYNNDVCPCITFNGVCQAENHTNVSFDYVLMQYTGLKDKNGKEIYEGDILGLKDEEDKSMCYIEFHNGAFVRTYKKFYSKIYADSITDDMWYVIGNIYEDKNLLK